MSDKKYTKPFIKAFKKLCKELDVLDLARYLKISPQDVRKIKKELKID